MIEIDLVRSRPCVRERHDSRLVGVAAEKGGPLFGCLAVTRFALYKQTASKSRRRRAASGRPDRRADVGWTPRQGQIRANRMQLAMQPDAGCVAHISSFSPRSPPERPIGERVFVRRRDARRLPKDDQADQSVLDNYQIDYFVER